MACPPRTYVVLSPKVRFRSLVVNQQLMLPRSGQRWKEFNRFDQCSAVSSSLRWEVCRAMPHVHAASSMKLCDMARIHHGCSRRADTFLISIRCANLQFRHCNSLQGARALEFRACLCELVHGSQRGQARSLLVVYETSTPLLIRTRAASRAASRSTCSCCHTTPWQRPYETRTDAAECMPSPLLVGNAPSPTAMAVVVVI